MCDLRSKTQTSLLPARSQGRPGGIRGDSGLVGLVAADVALVLEALERGRVELDALASPPLERAFRRIEPLAELRGELRLVGGAVLRLARVGAPLVELGRPRAVRRARAADQLVVALAQARQR